MGVGPAVPGPGRSPSGGSRSKVFHQILIVIHGSRGTGKSCLTKRMSGGAFDPEYSMTRCMQASEIIRHPIAQPNESVKVTVWDVVDSAVQSNPEVRRTKELPDAGTVDTFSRTDGIVVMYDPRRDETLDYALAVIDRAPDGIPLIVLANFKDEVTEAGKIPPQITEYGSKCVHLAVSMKTNAGLADFAGWLDLPLNVSLSKLYGLHVEESGRTVTELLERFAQSEFTEESMTVLEHEDNRPGTIPTIDASVKDVAFFDDSEDDAQVKENDSIAKPESHGLALPTIDMTAHDAAFFSDSDELGEDDAAGSMDEEDDMEIVGNVNVLSKHGKKVIVTTPVKLESVVPATVAVDDGFFGSSDDDDDVMEPMVMEEEEKVERPVKKVQILAKRKAPVTITKPTGTARLVHSKREAVQREEMEPLVFMIGNGRMEGSTDLTSDVVPRQEEVTPIQLAIPIARHETVTDVSVPTISIAEEDGRFVGMSDSVPEVVPEGNESAPIEVEMLAPQREEVESITVPTISMDEDNNGFFGSSDDGLGIVENREEGPPVHLEASTPRHEELGHVTVPTIYMDETNNELFGSSDDALDVLSKQDECIRTASQTQHPREETTATIVPKVDVFDGDGEFFESQDVPPEIAVDDEKAMVHAMTDLPANAEHIDFSVNNHADRPKEEFITTVVETEPGIVDGLGSIDLLVSVDSGGVDDFFTNANSDSEESGLSAETLGPGIVSNGVHDPREKTPLPTISAALDTSNISFPSLDDWASCSPVSLHQKNVECPPILDTKASFNDFFGNDVPSLEIDTQDHSFSTKSVPLSTNWGTSGFGMGSGSSDVSIAAPTTPAQLPQLSFPSYVLPTPQPALPDVPPVTPPTMSYSKASAGDYECFDDHEPVSKHRRHGGGHSSRRHRSSRSRKETPTD